MSDSWETFGGALQEESGALARVHEAVEERPRSAFEIVPYVYGERLSQDNAHWLLSKILCFLTHLQAIGEVHRIPGEPERWAA